MVFQFCEYIKAIGWYTLKGLILHVNYISVKLSFKKARKGCEGGREEEKRRENKKKRQKKGKGREGKGKEGKGREKVKDSSWYIPSLPPSIICQCLPLAKPTQKPEGREVWEM